MVELAGVVGPLGRSEGGQIGARCTLWLEKSKARHKRAKQTAVTGSQQAE